MIAYSECFSEIIQKNPSERIRRKKRNTTTTAALGRQNLELYNYDV